MGIQPVSKLLQLTVPWEPGLICINYGW